MRALARGGSITLAADAAGISRNALNVWKREDDEFAAEMADAIEQGTDRLEDAAVERAINGNSDTMLIFMLKGRRRDRWGDKQQVAHTDAEGNNLAVAFIPAPKREPNAD